MQVVQIRMVQVVQIIIAGGADKYGADKNGAGGADKNFRWCR